MIEMAEDVDPVVENGREFNGITVTIDEDKWRLTPWSTEAGAPSAEFVREARRKFSIMVFARNLDGRMVVGRIAEAGDNHVVIQVSKFQFVTIENGDPDWVVTLLSPANAPWNKREIEKMLQPGDMILYYIIGGEGNTQELVWNGDWSAWDGLRDFWNENVNSGDWYIIRDDHQIYPNVPPQRTNND